MRYIDSKDFKNSDLQGTIHERISALVDHFSRGNMTAFGRETDILPGVLASIVGGRKSKPSFDLLQKIMTRFPTISGDWLIMGRGPMLQKEQTIGKPPTRITALEKQKNLLHLPSLHNISTENIGKTLRFYEQVLEKLIDSAPPEVAQSIREIPPEQEEQL